MKRLLPLLFILAVLSGCTANPITINPVAKNIQIGNNPPGAGYVEVGAITAKHGGGCGLYGSQGDFEGAVHILKNKAYELGADYVQILHQEGEHMTGLCLDRAYVIDGMGYKKVSKK